jgi:hypothetical protein
MEGISILLQVSAASGVPEDWMTENMLDVAGTAQPSTLSWNSTGPAHGISALP